MRQILFGFLLLLVLPLPFLADAHSNEDLEPVTIIMTERGYDVKTLEIEVGQRVIFKNEGSEGLWPASNIHPTHEIYSEFDPKKPILPGQSWEFTFDKEGEWRFHDHLLPTIVGTIRVVSSNDVSVESKEVHGERSGVFSKVKTFFVNLINSLFASNRSTSEVAENTLNLPTVTRDTKEIFSNDELLKSYVQSFGPKATVEYLHELSAEFGDCHQSAHAAGHFAYELYGSEAFQACSAQCHSGCYHGATEAYFGEHGTKDLAKNLGIICGSVSNPFFSHQCIHGVGHGLTAWTSYDVPEALRACDLLPSGHESCYTGVFMENVVGGIAKDEAKNSEETAHVTQYLSQDPQFPCTVVDEKYKASCYIFQTSRMVQLYDGDFSKVAKACLAAPELYRAHCFQSMGRDVGGVNRGNPSRAIAECKHVPDGNFRSDCLVGAVQDSFWDSSGHDVAINFCKLLVDSTEKHHCYKTIIERAPQVIEAKTDRHIFCNKVETPFQQDCAAVIDLNI
ncbi:cupredoxin domain-containing protein [Patescibacteria group bacterium]|nr:cupredoxin domain-containing protein [Patescibacteria group bacterium]